MAFFRAMQLLLGSIRFPRTASQQLNQFFWYFLFPESLHFVELNDCPQGLFSCSSLEPSCHKPPTVKTTKKNKIICCLQIPVSKIPHAPPTIPPFQFPGHFVIHLFLSRIIAVRRWMCLGHLVKAYFFHGSYFSVLQQKIKKTKRIPCGNLWHMFSNDQLKPRCPEI